jgi:predicted methyltransferase
VNISLWYQLVSNVQSVGSRNEEKWSNLINSLQRAMSIYKNMNTIKITHLGNNMVSFQVFNQYNERLSHLCKMRDISEKEKYQDKLRKIFMKDGISVTVNDLTK